MECPNCHHKTSITALVHCTQCGQAFERGVLEELAHLDYLQKWLADHPDRSSIDEWGKEINLRRDVLHRRGTPPQPERTIPPAPVAVLVTESKPALEPAPAPQQQPEPIQPPAPKLAPRPAMNWSGLWGKAVDFVVSGALLRTLLYLGAFMIVISATVLVILFWDNFAPALQIAFIFSVPTIFYAAGWLIRTRLKLTQAGLVMTGIGALLFGVDFAAVYQFSHLRMDVNLWWLIASLTCLALYVFTAWRIRAEFFDYLALLAGMNCILALTRVIDAPLEWTTASVSIAGLGLALLSQRLHAARYLMHTLTPLSLIAVLFLISPAPFAQFAAYLAAALSYGWLARRLTSPLSLSAALITGIAALWFGLDGFLTDPLSWFPLAGAFLANGYIFTGWRFCVESKSYKRLFYAFGFGLSALAFVLGLPHLTEIEIASALTIISLAVLAWGLILNQPLLTLGGSTTFLLPFYSWLDQSALDARYYPLAYALLCALVYVPSGLFLDGRKRTHAQMLYLIGYGLSFLVAGIVLFTSVFEWGITQHWISLLTLPVLIGLYVFSAWRFKHFAFAWACAILLPLSISSWLGYFNVAPNYAAIVWAVLAFAYLIGERLLARALDPFSRLTFRLPLSLGMVLLSIIGLALSVWHELTLPALIAQIMIVALYIAAAVLHKSRIAAFVASALIILPYTLAWNEYGGISWDQFGYLWIGLAGFLLLCGFLLDRLPKDQPLYGQGAYFVGYALSVVAIALALFEQLDRVIVFGVAIGLGLLSFVVAHMGWHRSLEDVAGLLVKDTTRRRSAGVIFLFAFAFAFPLWFADLLSYWNARFEQIIFALTIVALVFVLLGVFARRGNSVYRFPFYLSGHLLAVITFFSALNFTTDDRFWKVGVYLIDSMLYIFSAWQFGHALWMYPAIFLLTLTYDQLTALINVPQMLSAIKRLPWILILIGIGRFVFHKIKLELKPPALIRSWSFPFYVFAYTLSAIMVLNVSVDPTAWTIACLAATLLYLGSALLFKHPAWLYPMLVAAHLTVIAYFSIHPTGSPARMITIPFMLLTWLEALAGLIIARMYPITQTDQTGRRVFKFFGRTIDFGSFPSIGYLTVPSWAQPIFIVALIDIFAWEGLALSGFDTGVIVSLGYGLLLALLSWLWIDSLLTHASLVFFLLTAGWQLRSMRITSTLLFVWYAGMALGFGWLSILMGRFSRQQRAGGWSRALSNVGFALSVLCALVALVNMGWQTEFAAYIFGLVGAFHLTMAVSKRSYGWGYLGFGLILLAWCLLLFVRNADQPQFYAIPSGLYFAVIGFLERRRRPGRFPMLIESLGLAILLVTSFIQSLDGAAGFPYFLLLLVEGLIVIWWGAARRLRVPFLIGIASSVINVIAQVIVLVSVYDINRWFIIFGVGILLMGLGLIVERRRERLLAQAQSWRETLEKWE